MDRNESRHFIINPKRLADELSEKKRNDIEATANNMSSELLNRELVKSEQEIFCIRTVQASIKELCVSLNIEPIHFDPEKIHIFSQEEFKRAHPHISETTHGLIHRNHIFVVRGEEKEFIGTLTHEVAHAISFQQQIVDINADNENTTVKRAQKRVGFGIDNFRKRTRYAEGFNEGMTELCAQELRQRYMDILNKNGHPVPELDLVSDYLPQIIVIGAVLRHLHDDAFFTVLTAFLTGDNTIYASISNELATKGFPRDTLKKLFEMKISVASVRETAEKIGLSDTIEEINAYFPNDESSEDAE